MTDEPLNGHSEEYSNRFTHGERSGRTPEEERAFLAYSKIREQLRNYPASLLDTSEYTQSMMEEMRKKDTRRWDFSLPCLRPVLAVGVLSVLLLSAGAFFLNKPEHLPVNRIHLFNQTRSVNTPWLWEHWLQKGYTVTVPGNYQAKLSLSDGSVIDCEPDTRLSIRFDNQRRIRLIAGEVTIHAAHISGSTMTVETPYMNVQVIGTIFRLKVIE